MTFNEKLEILINRKRIRRVEFAESVGVTYRAFAYYMNGTRRPRRAILERIANSLDVTPEFLQDDRKALELTAEETFLKNIRDRGGDTAEAASFLAKSRGLMAGNSLTDEDKAHLLDCLREIYNDIVENKQK